MEQHRYYEGLPPNMLIISILQPHHLHVAGLGRCRQQETFYVVANNAASPFNIIDGSMEANDESSTSTTTYYPLQLPTWK